MNDASGGPANAARRDLIKSGLAVASTALLPGAKFGATTSRSNMVHQKVWLITGAGRGLGLEIAKAALAAGHCVVATGRDPVKVAEALGENASLLSVKLDVTRPEDSQLAIASAVRRFGRIDVLVNNAGNFYAGFFEELTPQQVRDQIETLLFGPMNVTRAALPVMRKQRSGLLLTISSTAGIAGGLFCTAYAAAKFGIEGWMESLAPEVAPFGIRTMLVEPGFFRTELLSAGSTTYAKPALADYAERSARTIAAWNDMDGKQSGDPVRLARALVELAAAAEPPGRFAAGADAVTTFEAKAHTLLSQADAHRALSASLAREAA
jgi:NAD(P)-dependent dehydrogenase (short-subunit alcohol dehydrogenase family)